MPHDPTPSNQTAIMRKGEKASGRGHEARSDLQGTCLVLPTPGHEEP